MAAPDGSTRWRFETAMQSSRGDFNGRWQHKMMGEDIPGGDSDRRHCQGKYCGGRHSGGRCWQGEMVWRGQLWETEQGETTQRETAGEVMREMMQWEMATGAFKGVDDSGRYWKRRWQQKKLWGEMATGTIEEGDITEWYSGGSGIKGAVWDSRGRRQEPMMGKVMEWDGNGRHKEMLHMEMAQRETSTGDISRYCGGSW